MRRGLHGTRRPCVTVLMRGGSVGRGGTGRRSTLGGEGAWPRSAPPTGGTTGHTPLGPAHIVRQTPTGHAHQLLIAPPASAAIFGWWHRGAIFVPGTSGDRSGGRRAAFSRSVPRNTSGDAATATATGCIPLTTVSPPFSRHCGLAVPSTKMAAGALRGCGSGAPRDAPRGVMTHKARDGRSGGAG